MKAKYLISIFLIVLLAVVVSADTLREVYDYQGSHTRSKVNYSLFDAENITSTRIETVDLTATGIITGNLTVNASFDGTTITPTLNDTYDLGSTLKYWANLFVTTINLINPLNDSQVSINNTIDNRFTDSFNLNISALTFSDFNFTDFQNSFDSNFSAIGGNLFNHTDFSGAWNTNFTASGINTTANIQNLGFITSSTLNSTFVEFVDFNSIFNQNLTTSGINTTANSINLGMITSSVLNLTYINQTGFTQDFLRNFSVPFENNFTDSFNLNISALTFSDFNFTDFQSSWNTNLTASSVNTTANIENLFFLQSSTLNTTYLRLSGDIMSGDLNMGDNNIFDVNDIGNTTDEIDDVYIGTNQNIYFGDAQESQIYYNGSSLILKVN